MEKHKVGDIYTNIGDLYVASDYLKYDSWFTSLRADRSKYYKFPKGTLFELIDIKYNKKSSWNTGTYYYHTGKLKVLSGDKKDKVYETMHIMTHTKFGVDEGQIILKKQINKKNHNQSIKRDQ